MDFDASRIRVTTALDAIRRRPLMYFGMAADDPGLPGAALSLAVQDALTETPFEATLHVEVVIEGPLRFSVEDDGPGLPIEPADPRDPPVITELMTTPLCGRQPIHRTGMAAVTAVSTEAVADVWRDGRHYRQRADRTGEQLPLEVLKETGRHGTRLTYRLDDSYLAPAAELPRDVAPLLSGIFALPQHPSHVPRPAPGTTLTLHDHRTDTRTHLRH
ncbi:hypothetical protein [Actinomadura oligospora]|uniref:hypothetical protein n=1 Tax=Actinomadura oligospora TaxID=111804 RepID=UPI0004ACE8B7|nr:hypothetical protein [Actinomadura oligospora]